MRLFRVNSAYLDNAIFDELGLSILVRRCGGSVGVSIEEIDEPTDDDYASVLDWGDDAQAFM